MHENKENINFLLVLFTGVMFLCLTIVGIFFIGVAKVDAKSYYWTEPFTISYNNTNTFNTNPVAACSSTNSCFYSDTGNYVANYSNIRYRPLESNNNETYFDQNTYEVSIRFRLVALDTLNKNNTKVTMWVYPYNNDYLKATCDGTETTTITYNNNTDIDVYVEYKCTALKITGNFSNFGIQVGSTPNTIFATQISQNLRLIGPGEATNDDIINNQNQNTQDIINNQNQNTQDVIDSVTNPDVSGSNDTIGGFFGSFSDTDHGGLSGIITAPLVAFNQMLTGTCVDLSVEYKGNNTTLPCGTSFWNQISPIRDFLNVTLGGLICYQIVRKLFLLIQKIKNPEDDRVEVMSL